MKKSPTIYLKGFIWLLFLYAQLTLVAQSGSSLWKLEIVRSNLIGAWTRVGDFNKDGKPDMLIQNGDSLFWYENHRPGWTAHLIDPLFKNSAFAFVDVFDLDLDGDLDVLQAPIPQGNSMLAWNENQENGFSWIRHELINSSLGNMKDSYGDLDGDRDLDIVFTGVTISWLEHKSGNDWLLNPISDFTTHEIWAWTTVLDMNNDGKLDVAGGDFESGRIVWFENPSWARHSLQALPSSIVGSTADLNGDGKKDLIVSNTEGDIIYYKSPTFSRVLIAKLPNAWHDLTDDIDGDGDLDVTFGGSGFGSGDLGWVENLGNGASWKIHLIDAKDEDQRIITGFADIDGDGDKDFTALSFNTTNYKGDARWYANPSISTATREALNVKNIQLKSFPNPFANQTILEFELKDNTLPVEIVVTDVLGRAVKSLRLEKPNTGMNQIPLNMDAPAGLLFLTLKQGTGVKMIKMIKQ